MLLCTENGGLISRWSRNFSRASAKCSRRRSGRDKQRDETKREVSRNALAYDGGFREGRIEGSRAEVRIFPERIAAGTMIQALGQLKSSYSAGEKEIIFELHMSLGDEIQALIREACGGQQLDDEMPNCDSSDVGESSV